MKTTRLLQRLEFLLPLCVALGGFDHYALATDLGPIFPLDGGTQLATRSDGTTIIVETYHECVEPAHVLYREIRVGKIEFGATNQTPFQVRANVTSPGCRFPAYNPDVALNATNALVVYTDKATVIPDEPHAFNIAYSFLAQDSSLSIPAVAYSETRSWADEHVAPRVSMNSAGQFAVAFFYETAPYDSFAYGRLFDASGSPLGSAFTVNQHAGAYAPTVALANDGSSLYVWERAEAAKYSFSRALDDIWVRRVDSAGNPLGDEFRINTTLNCRHGYPQIAMNSTGNFVVAWQQLSSDADGIYAQLFDSSGTVVGPETRVSPYNGTDPQVALAADGRFVVAWQGQDDDGSGLFAQRFLADGSRYGNTMWVNEGATNSQTQPLLGMADDGTFIVKWNEGTNHFARWISWDSTNQIQILGPHVQSLVPAVAASETISNVTVVFDRPMDTASFAATNAYVIDPVGRVVPVTSVQTADNRAFTIGFAPQYLPGRYHVRVGPNIQDADAASMDENGNTIKGEPADVFFGQFTLTSSVIAAFPIADGFEAGPDGVAGWSFDSFHSGKLVFTTSNGPHRGTNHLWFSDTANESATLAIDLSGQAGQTNLFVDFWAKGYYTLNVELSGDGETWFPMLSFNLYDTGLPNDYTEFALDLDQAASSNGVAFDNNVFVRFRFPDGASAYLDEVKVTAGDLPLGPRVTAHSPTVLAASNAVLNSIMVTLDKAIDPATFTGADVILKDPFRAVVSGLVVSPIAGTDNRQFELVFPAQLMRGEYVLRIGPNVADVTAHSMNQNNNHVNGEASDVYSGVVNFASAVLTTGGGPVVFEETFEGWPLAAYWSFGSFPLGIGGGFPSDYSPHRGFNQLVVGADGGDTSTGAHSGWAVLALDLSGQTGQTNLFLDFWARNSGGASFFVQFSTNSSSWVPILNAVAGQYTHFTVDLDAILATNGISLGTPTFFRFGDSVPVSPYSQVGQAVYLDDIRILSGAPADLIPPAITNQPQSVFASPGTNVEFTVIAVGTGPLSYQWWFNGEPILDETNATLLIANVQPANCGDYRVLVSNAVGTELSTLVILGGVNDNFTNRIAIAGTQATVRGLNSGATSEVGERSTGWWENGKSVWWKWTAPATGRVVISTIGSDFNTVLGVFTGAAISNLTLVAAADDNAGSGYADLVSFVANAGTEYQIRVAGSYYYISSVGAVVLNLTFSTNWPSIVGQPQSQSTTEGFGAAFSVAALGAAPLAYQWQFNGTNLVGATAATLLLTNVLLSQTGNYRVVVTNSFGSETSAAATLTVIPHNDAFTNRYVLTGSSLVATGLNVNATKEPGEPVFGYFSRSVWWTWTAPGTGRVLISLAGSTFSTLLRVFTGATVTNLTAIATEGSTVSFIATNGVEYQIMVEGYIYSTPAGNIRLSLDFSEHWPTITSQPQNQTATEGYEAGFSVTVAGDSPFTYQWQFNGTNLVGETSASLLLTNVLLSQAGNYRVVVTNSFGSETSAAATLTVIPHNDDFTNRYVLTGSSLVATGLNVNATKEAGEPVFGYYSRSVWWSWTAPGTGRVVMSLAGSTFSTLLRVFTGDTVTNLMAIATDGNSGSFIATNGVEYQIMVEGYIYSTPVGNIRLSLDFSEHWPTITSQPQNQTATEGYEAGFSVTVAGDAPFTYQWQFNGTNLVGETSASLLLTNVLLSQAGNYRVVVTNSFGSETSVAATLTVIPHNDDFTNRYVLTGSSLVATGLNVNATKESGEPVFGYYSRSVWWSWTAPGTGRVVMSLAGSTFSTLLRVFTGETVTNLTAIATDGNSVSFIATNGVEYQIMVEGYIYSTPAGNIRLSLDFSEHWPTITGQPQNQTVEAGSDVAFSVSAMGDAPLAYRWQFGGTNLPGETGPSLLLSHAQSVNTGDYRVIVTNNFGSETSATAVLTVIVRPPNDHFTNRIVLTGLTNTVIGSNVNATKEPEEPSHFATGTRSVWWSWTAPASGPAIINTEGSSFDTVLAVYTGNSLSNLVLVTSDDDSGAGATSLVRFNAAQGTTYQIAVDSYFSSSGNIILNLNLLVPNLTSPSRLANGQFQFQLTGPVGGNYVVQASEDLVTWTPIATNLISAAGFIPVTDPSATNYTQRFYRAVSP